MLSDFRFAVRALSRNRGFTLITLFTLALGIGSAAAIFNVTDWVLFRAPKYPADIFLIGGQSGQNPFVPIRFDFMTRAYAEQTNVMSEYAKASPMTGNVVIDGGPVATAWLGVSANLFPMLGITPALGRGFLPGEDVTGADQVIVVTAHFWRQHLGGRPDALGRKIAVGDAVCTVVGVLGETQAMPPYLYSEIYRPLAYHVDPKQPWAPNLFLFGRLRQGLTRAGAQKALAAAKVDSPESMRAYLRDDQPALSSLTELNHFFRAEIYWMILGAVGFLYAIACLNASNLMLVRMLGQRRELSIRLALGAGRGRVIRLLAIESLTLAVAGSLTGALVANWLFPLLLTITGGSAFTGDWTHWNLGWRVLGVMGLLTLVTSLAIVAIPAFRVLRADIHSGLKDGGAALGESRALARLRGFLVVLQAAFAVILLAGAGLMIRTFHQFQKVDLGFEPSGRAKVQINFPADETADWEPRLARLKTIRETLRRIPGVRAVSFGGDLLLPGYYYTTHTLHGPGDAPIKAQLQGFAIGYQDAAGLVLKRGRWLDQSRGNEIMINESLAHTLWPNQDPVGQLVRPVENNAGAPKDWTGWVVAGVVGDIRATMRDAPGFYLFGPEGWGPGAEGTFIVRLSRDGDEAFAGLISRTLYAFDPRLVVTVVPVSQVRDNQLWAERMANSVLSVLAGIAVLLTVVGVFSVLAYTVDRRMGEFGVRMALGATRRDLIRLVLSRGVWLSLGGIVLGIGGALALTRFLQSLLFETSAQDPWTLGAVGAILLLTSVAACIIPARRATRVDITKLLRSE